MTIGIPIHKGTAAIPPHIVLDCRKTQKGAYTGIVQKTAGVETREISESRSGRSWKVALFFAAPTDWVYVQDISNTGFHDCYRLYGNGSKELICARHQTTAKDESCLARKRERR